MIPIFPHSHKVYYDLQFKNSVNVFEHLSVSEIFMLHKLTLRIRFKVRKRFLDF